MTEPERLDAVLREALDGAGLDYERTGPGSYLVQLAGEHKLATTCVLSVGEHAMVVEAFVMRRPDEHREELYRFLLRRNTRTYGVAWALDQNGDVFLSGRVPLGAVDADELDRVLGSVLSYADETFNTLLEMGFETSIRREWAWRRARGESTANLAAFTHLAEPAG